MDTYTYTYTHAKRIDTYLGIDTAVMCLNGTLISIETVQQIGLPHTVPSLVTQAHKRPVYISAICVYAAVVGVGCTAAFVCVSALHAGAFVAEIALACEGPVRVCMYALCIRMHACMYVCMYVCNV